MRLRRGGVRPHQAAVIDAEPRRRMHPSTWLVWAFCTVTVALLLRNPWYLAEVGAVALAMQWRLSRQRLARSMLLFFASLITFPTLLNLAFSRAGETVLLRLPVPFIGGPYTLEALLFGVSAGIQIACVLAVLMVFGEAVTPADLLRRSPRGFYAVGLSATIALTFAPRAYKALTGIREAQQIRGHEPRGWRDLPRLFTPLVVLSLESAFALAEGMVARGWSGSGLEGWRRWLAPTGWVLLAAGLSFVALVPGAGLWPLLILAAGIAVTVTGLRRQAAGGRYRPEAWRRADSVASGLALGVLSVFLILSLLVPEWLGYYPYPRAEWPSFHPALALALGLLAAPLWRTSSSG